MEILPSYLEYNKSGVLLNKKRKENVLIKRVDTLENEIKLLKQELAECQHQLQSILSLKNS